MWTVQLSEEAGGTELPFLVGNGTSANSTTGDAFSNPTYLRLGGLPLELN